MVWKWKEELSVRCAAWRETELEVEVAAGGRGRKLGQLLRI